MFSSITQPKYPNAALGIESNAMSAVSLSGGKRGYSIKQAGSLDLPPGLVLEDQGARMLAHGQGDVGQRPVGEAVGAGKCREAHVYYPGENVVLSG